MKRLLTLTLTLLLVCSVTALVQSARASNTGNQSNTNTTRKRGPVFRATKDQVNQAQAILKRRGLYDGEQTGKLDDATRAALKKFQQAEGLKTTGTLNKATLEKMGVALTEKQKEM